MPSPEPRHVVAHVERTADPAVLRWVVHEPQVGGDGTAVALEEASALGRLLGDGLLASVHVRRGEVRAQAGAGHEWAGLVDVVDAAMRADLAAGALPAGGSDGGPAQVDIEELQRVVNRAAGSLTELHGGRVEVVGVEGAVLQVRMHGTCDGCSFTGATLERLVLPAARRALPEVAAVEVVR